MNSRAISLPRAWVTVGVVVDRRVVHERVETPRAVQNACRQVFDALVVRDVELARENGQALLRQPRRGPLAFLRIPASEDDGEASPGELARHFESDAAVGAGHEGDAHSLSRRLAHALSPRSIFW
jgi:hypothetical protein